MESYRSAIEYLLHGVGFGPGWSQRSNATNQMCPKRRVLVMIRSLKVETKLPCLDWELGIARYAFCNVV
jgi:hypothetical protein